VIFAIPWTADRIAAIVVGLGVIAFLRQFFFGKSDRPGVRAASTASGSEATIVVAGGYDPDVVVAKQGVPLTLIFDRRESNPCTDEIVIPDFGIRQALPAFAETRVRIVPPVTGDFPFTCGMNMLHGKIRVEPASPA
jgi:Cu+-exporting ATPase